MEVEGGSVDSTPTLQPLHREIEEVLGQDAGLSPTTSPTEPRATQSIATITPSPVSPLPTATSEGSASKQSATIFEQMGEILEAEGARVRIGDPVDQDYLRTAARILEVEGEKVLVFAFPNERAAQAASQEISEDGRTIGDRDINFRTDPYYFIKDRFILLTVSQDERILDLFQQALGDPFAGGKAEFQRPEGFVIETAEDVYHAFLYEGAEVEVGKNLNAPVQTEEAFYILVEGEEVQLYQMSTREDAERVAGAISEDGTSIGVFPIPANGTPHFFLAGRVIVFYQGDNLDLLELLVRVLGEPITENI